MSSAIPVRWPMSRNSCSRADRVRRSLWCWSRRSRLSRNQAEVAGAVPRCQSGQIGRLTDALRAMLDGVFGSEPPWVGGECRGTGCRGLENRQGGPCPCAKARALVGCGSRCHCSAGWSVTGPARSTGSPPWPGCASRTGPVGSCSAGRSGTEGVGLYRCAAVGCSARSSASAMANSPAAVGWNGAAAVRPCT
jgi:hypothetical protein